MIVILKNINSQSVMAILALVVYSQYFVTIHCIPLGPMILNDLSPVGFHLNIGRERLQQFQ